MRVVLGGSVMACLAEEMEEPSLEIRAIAFSTMRGALRVVGRVGRGAGRSESGGLLEVWTWVRAADIVPRYLLSCSHDKGPGIQTTTRSS